MPKIVSLNEQMEELYSMSLSGQRSSNRGDREKMKKMLTHAMNSVLTERQSVCLKMYYFDRKTMAEIGSMLGLNTSTVSRHISAAVTKLQKLRSFIL